MEGDLKQTGPLIAQVGDKLVVTDPKVIRVILHEQKLQILKILVHEMKNIQELRDLTQLNPGTIKRNLDELMEYHLVYVAAIKKSDYNITMKYYRATGNRIEISYQFPEKEQKF